MERTAMFLKIFISIHLMFAVGAYAQEEATPTVKVEKVNISDDEIVALLKEKYKDTVMEGFIKSNPRLTLLVVRTVKDENIINSWKESFKDKTRYFYFTAFLIISFFINWVWKRRQIQTFEPLSHRIGGFFLRFGIINGSRVAFFIFLFRKEISPIWSLFRKTFDI